MKVNRFMENPLVTPGDVSPYHEGFEVIGAFNAGVCRYNGQIIMLLRVAERPVSQESGKVRIPVVNIAGGQGELRIIELDMEDSRFDFSDPRVVKDVKKGKAAYLTSLSYLRIARSRDGRRFTVDESPFLYPELPEESFGIEDPRITQIGDVYYITYSAVSEKGVGVGLVSTRDFTAYTRHGLIFPPENKDVVIFPEKIGGKYYALHRPVPKDIGAPEIWIAESHNLLHWGNHRYLLGLREGCWDSKRIGGGAVPIKTEKGWLEIYHAADGNDRYCMGAVLLDLNDPSRVIARTKGPILEPETEYEREGFFGNVVFSCGVLLEGDQVYIYYGVADSSMACAQLSLKEIMDALVEI